MASESKLDTALFRKSFESYNQKPTEENALICYNLLPRQRTRIVVGGTGDNLQVLEQQVARAKPNSVKLAFALFTISDGAFTEWLQIMLGKLIHISPELFLEELKAHRHLCHELPILNF